MNLQSFSSLFDLLQALPTEQACLEHYEKLRGKNGVVSPYDPSSKVYNYGNEKYHCKNTGCNFNVKTGKSVQKKSNKPLFLSMSYC